MKRRHAHVLPEPAPRQMTLSYASCSADEDVEIAEPRFGGVPDDALGERLAAMRESLRAKGSIG